MLFANREVAEFIDATFEPVWVSVRPAPLVTIDFGNGHQVTRTLQGNIATYVCDAAGIVHDLLPGIYTPKPYREQLALMAKLVNDLSPLSAADRATRLRKYHHELGLKLNKPVPTTVAAVARIGGGGKGGFASTPISGMQFGGQGAFGGQPPMFPNGGFASAPAASGYQLSGQGGFGGNPAPFGGGIEGPLEAVMMNRPIVPPTPPGGDLASRADLQFDVVVNETVRRKFVHDYLASSGPVKPDDLKKWLYRVVLKADLDDPLLGLGPVLNANYPFAGEEISTARQ